VNATLFLLISGFLMAWVSSPSVGGQNLAGSSSPPFRDRIQLWLRAENLSATNGQPLHLWPDISGNNRDAEPTGTRLGGAGTAPVYVSSSSINGRPAVRFSPSSGLGTPGNRPLPINGDAGFSIFIVVNLQYQEGQSRDVIVGFGEAFNPANSTGSRPAAALLEIDRTFDARHRLDHAGGFKRDALIGRPGSYGNFYELPQVISLIKKPGSMKETSSIRINGELIDETPASGTSESPDYRHRSDFDVILGHAHAAAGALLGDIAEVMIYDMALTEEGRRAVETDLMRHYGLGQEDTIEDPGPKSEADPRRRHWAFQVPVRPRVPAAEFSDVSKWTPIDAFLLEKLRARGLGFSPEATRAALFRRLSFDLTGLPPDPAASEAFVSSDDPLAYGRVVDQFLASPHFGERWGRHWLDLVGYVDVTGNDQNAEQIILGPSKWRYRDYVIRSLNQNRPWDKFLAEQIAGDELVEWRTAETFTDDHRDALIATGSLRTAIDDTHEVDLNKLSFRYQVIHDTVQILGSSLFGLTLQCARCHDHKFDPIPTRDYYRIMALLTPALNVRAWLQPKDRELPDVSAREQAEITAHNAGLDRKIKPLAELLTALRASCTNRIVELRLRELPEAAQIHLREALASPADKRSAVQKSLLAEHETRLKITQPDLDRALTAEENGMAKDASAQIEELEGQRRRWGTIRAFFESGPPPRDYTFRRGDYAARGSRIGPGFLSVLCDSDSQARLEAVPKVPGSSGRRLAFARWVTHPRGAPAGLHARVWMNRCWQQLFGEGLVPTPDNFGVKGLPPVHPELLDWLAREFIDSGWNFKGMVRQMVTSVAYRQSSRRPEDLGGTSSSLRADPDNALLWRQRMRRIEAESIRDALLAISGRLDSSMYGPAVPLINLPDGSAALPSADKLPTPTSQWRRSIYLMGRRNFHLPILGSFDQPVINTTCSRRMNSAVVLQPLTMLNDPFVREQASFFARRLSPIEGSAMDRIVSAFRHAYGRRPEADEIESAMKYWSEHVELLKTCGRSLPEAEQQALADFCQLLFNSNELLYLE